MELHGHGALNGAQKNKFSMQTLDPLARGQWGRESWIQLKQRIPNLVEVDSAARYLDRVRSNSVIGLEPAPT